MGFLLSPGAFENGIPPAYNLKKNQDRKVLVWIECPYSSGADHDVQQLLGTAFELYMVEKAHFDPDNVLIYASPASQTMLLDPKEIARSQGAGYVLLVTVDSYEVDFLQVRDYYAGDMITRALLIDVDLGTPVWPRQPEGKMVQITVELESDGRDALISRMVSAVAHCTMRHLYPCDKLKYKHADERISMQEAYEIETF